MSIFKLNWSSEENIGGGLQIRACSHKIVGIISRKNDILEKY